MRERAYDYSVRIAELVRFLREDGAAFPLCDQLLCCGVDVGMALESAERASASAAHSALGRAQYLLGMAVTSGYLTQAQSGYLLEETRALLELTDPEQKK